MKTISILTAAILIILTSFSCRKDTPMTDVSGTIKAYGTESPIPNARVYLTDCISLGGLGGVDCGVTKDSTLSDTNGNYEFNFQADDGHFYWINVEAEGYYKGSSTTNVLEDRTSNLDVTLDPEAWLKLHIKNINPVDESDFIRFSCGLTEEDWTNEQGSNIDTIHTWYGRGNKEGELIWKTTKNGVTEEFRDTIYIPAHDTLEYEIFY